MSDPTFAIRVAQPDDAEAIHGFIYELAVYEREPDAVEATPQSLRQQMESDRPPFECVIAEEDGVAVGMALYFPNYSTWKGVPGIYLEDLYVQPAHRGKGYGAALLAELAAIAVDRNYARVDWQVLDWNTPSIDFYASVGAEIKRDWIPCRLTGDALTAMAEQRARS